MATCAFEDPIRRLMSELAWLQREFLMAVKSGNHRSAQLTCEMTIVRMHDAWARYCRELIILSAVGRTVTLTGTPLLPASSAITGCSLVVPELLATYRKKNRMYEPRWGDAKECIDAGKRLAIRNYATVAAALAAVDSPADDIRNVRNYYAHRTRGTAEKAALTKIFSVSTQPSVFELAAYKKGGNRIIESWANGLILIATAAAQ